MNDQVKEEDLNNLVHRKTKTPFLHPIPPLPLFDIKKKRSKSSHKRGKSSQNVSQKFPSTSSIPEDEQVEIFKPKLPKSFYIMKLKEWAEEIPINGLMPSWESNIISMIPNSLKTKYPKCLAELLREIKLIYIKEMQKFAISSIVINDKGQEFEDDTIITPNEKPLVSKNNKLFLKNRNQFQKNYFLSHNLMKHIISTARQKLTSVIVDFSNYRTLGLLSISDFQNMIFKNMRNSTLIIKHEYYKEIMKIVNSKRHLKTITKDEESKFMHCATNLFIQQIIQNMMETINIMLDIIKNVEYFPQLNFELVITKGIENLKDIEINISLNPSIESVCNIYHQVINDISNIFKNDLLCFKCKNNDDNNHIWVNLPDWFLKKSHDKLSEILSDLFKPLRDDFSNIVDEFNYVCSPITRDLIINLVLENRDFSVYCNHVKNLNTYISKTNEMVSYMYYNVGRLSQVNAKDNLHGNISELIKILIDKMINYHWDYNRSIYNEFKCLENRALDIPRNAKALFKLSETILLASTVTVKKLEKKIEKSVEMLSELLQLTDLSDNHIEFNKLTINYLFSISDVFTQSNILCEAMKSELEDELQRKINILNIKVEEIIPEFIIMDNMDDANHVHEYIEFLKILVAKVQVLDKDITSINREEKLFKFPETSFSRVDEIKDIILPFYNLNRMIFLWKRHNDVWLDGPFEYIESSKVEEITVNYFEEFTNFNRTIKTKIKLDMTTPNKPFKFSGLIDDPDPMQQPAPLKLCFQVIQNVKEFKQYIRLINCMCNPALTERHWKEMSIIYGSDITPNAGTTLRKIIALDLMENIDKYEVISISADKELALQQQLNEMTEEWDNVRFDISEDCNDRKRLIFVNLKSEIQVKMEEHLVKIEEMKGSYFVKPIADDVEDFYRALICVRDTIDMWNHLYDELIVMKPIFEFTKTFKFKPEGLEDSKDFEFVQEFKFIFDVCGKIEVCLSSVKEAIMEDPTFLKIGRSTDYLNKLQQCQMFIKIANEKIYDYLAKMRNIFPRFFFLSDKEIVDIIFTDESGRNRADKVVRLLKKCFYGIKNVKLNSDGDIVGVVSDYDQEFNLTSWINPEGVNWLINTENSIIETVKKSIDSMIQKNHDNFNDFINNFIYNIFNISMVILKISWTCKVENCLRNSNENPLEKFNLMLETQNSLIISVIDELKNENFCKKIIMKNKRLILITLASVLIHQRDVLSFLIDKIVINSNDFHWVSQLRHYYIDKSLKIEMIYVTKNYGYEFNSIINSSIINTPLTDRIYHTIFQASRNNYFCSLIGPADTGKTETVKNLAMNELGLQFYLINCTKNLTCDRVSSLLKGLIFCGAWLTFKNINHSQISILSAITQRFSQILKIISNKKSKNLNNLDFEDFDIFNDLSKIKYSGFITTTMILNPGRLSMFQKHEIIPNNLRAIFRPITIHHPDLEKILEVNLLSAGFKNAKIITKKIMTFLKLCSEQLDSKHKYLFSLRSLISMIKNTVRLKFQFPEFPEEENEESIILRSIIDVYLGILRKNHIPIFLEFLRDVFPHVYMFPPDYTNFYKILEELSIADAFEIHDNFKLKIIQILEIMHIKQSFIIFGESYTGKTKILKILSKCLSELHPQNDNSGDEIFLTEIINHKSMKLENLFGHNQIINNNKKWIDGICTSILRNFLNNYKDKINEFNMRKFLIFDGPIDSLLMENLSTISDEHKTLFLDSGEGIKIPETISIIFETENLNNSTPAMISRCGIIHMESDTIDWKMHMRCWVIEQNSYIQSKNNNFMINILNWSLEFLLKFLNNCSLLFLNVSEVFPVISILKLLKIYLLEAMESNKTEGTCDDFNIHFKIWFQAALILSIIWGISGILYSDDSINKLDEYCVSIWSQRPKQISHQPDITLPGGLIQDHNYVFKAAGVWKSWTEIIKNSKEIFIDSKFIPTASTLQLTSIFESHIKHKIPFIICGDRSIGKTTMIEFILKKKIDKKLLSNIFNFTSQIPAEKYFLLKINRIITGRYSPKKEKCSINFIDDLNMMKREDDSNNNSGLSLELIRQLMDHGYWFSSNNNDEKFQKIFVKNIMFLAALTRQKNNSSEIYQRFIRHFNLYFMSPPSKENIFKIFSTLLLNNLKKNQFSADVGSSVNSMIHTIIQVYNSIILNNDLRPIPLTNFNYQFNLKDIERVINGCSLIHRESAETKITLIRILVHESLRVFGDRLTNKSQKNWLFSTIKEAININFSKESFDSIFDHLPKHNDQLTSESFENFMFCNFIDSVGDPQDNLGRRRRYEEITCSKEIVKTKLISYMTLYNETVESSKKMDIIIFSDIIAHLIRLCRCLCTPSANFLMLSINGGSTGRQTLTRLSSFIQKCKFFDLTNDSDWKEDLKKATKYIAECGNDCSFFIPCRYLKCQHLMDINCLMCTGEIADLFSEDNERQEIIKSARLPAQNGDRNLEIGMIEIMNYFHEQCQEKLHFVLYINLFDEIKCQGNSNYRLLKSYPNIVNSCSIDCFDNWPQEAIYQLGTKYLNNLTVINNFTKEKVVSAAVNIYQHSRLIIPINNYTTASSPYGFINMMKLYSKIMAKKHEKITESRHRYQIGLEKLQYAEQQVSKMKLILTDLKPQLEESAKQMEETMREIETENMIVENATIQMKRDEEIANKTAEIAALLKAECEADLAVAIPILEDAIAALNTLKPADITLVKAMKNPPDTVKLVMAAVCVMLNISSDRIIDPVTGKKSMDYWGPSKRILGEMNFLQILKDYDKNNIPANLMTVIKKTYMTDKSFMPHIVAKASSAAEGLCKWVRAMVSYDEIAKIVAPKKEKLALAEKECNDSLAFLNEKRKTLAELTSKLTALNETLSDTLIKKIQLENQVKSCIEKLKKSEGLVASLDVEKIKWKTSVDSLKTLLETLAGDILISSGIIAFLSSFDETFRHETIDKWKDIIQEERIIISKSYDFLRSLESQITIDSWRLFGLSRNRFYAENVVIMDNFNFCILIDPQNQANLWIRKMEEKNNLKIFKLSDIHLPHYRQQIIICMKNNYPVLLENLKESFSPLDLDMIHQLKLQNQDPDEQSFRFYMTTRLDNPSFNLYILKKINIINFHLPKVALDEQLLNIVLAREQPELYEKFNNLDIKSNVNKQILQQEEKNILVTLSSTSTSVAILEDERALKSLDGYKKLLMEIIQKEEATNEARKEIDKYRKYYSNFTSYSANFYQTLISLAALNPMYQFSLTSFTQIFIKSIDTSRQSYIIEKRLKYLKCSFTQTLHSSVRNSLFEDHKIIYSFLLCLNMITSDDGSDVNSNEIDYFFDNSKYYNFQTKSFDFFHQFSSEKYFEKLQELEIRFPIYQGIVESLKNDENLWKKFLSINDLEDNNLPIPWNSKLSIFQQLLVIKILKPEKLLEKINKFIDFVMKLYDVSPSQISGGLAQSYLQSTCLIPLIIILPTYREPLKMITEYGKKFGYTSKIFTISLGGPNDSKKIKDLILHCQREGSWVVIQNCHLADTSTMLQLEKIHEHQKNTSDTLLGFRLWLSSLPSHNFPIGILQDGIKITNSPPKDLKDSLINFYQSDPLNRAEFFNSCPGNDKIFSMMIYGFCLFHSILRERKKFGDQGWNVDYEFLPSDFNISVWQLENLLKIAKSSSDKNYFVEGIFYLVSKCNYGGRIIDGEDEKFVDRIFKDFCNEEIGGKRNYCIFDEHSWDFVGIPDRCEYKDFMKHVEDIDNCDKILKVFGLDDNVRIMRDLGGVQNVFNSLNLMNLIENKGDDERRKNRNILRVKIIQIENQLPEFINIEKVKCKFHFDYSKPLNYILIEEINDFNLTIKEFKVFLRNNRESKISNDLKFNETISLFELMKILNDRSIFLNNWIDNEFPKRPIKLNLILSPKKLFSAIKLMFSKECSIDVTKITLKSEILGFKNSKENLNLINNEKSIYIEGLFLSGGKWDEIEGKLVVNGPREFWNNFPVVHITPGIIENYQLNNFDDKFFCPLYKSVIQRDLLNFSGNLENFVIHISLKSDISTSFWIKRGTALFCHISEIHY